MKELTAGIHVPEVDDAIEGRIVGTQDSKPGYADACVSAATRQGLTEIALRLAIEDIRFRIDQTGGFCMVLFVPREGDKTIGVTSGEEEKPGWLVVLYDDTVEEDEGIVLAWNAPTQQAIDIIHEHGTNRPAVEGAPCT